MSQTTTGEAAAEQRSADEGREYGSAGRGSDSGSAGQGREYGSAGRGREYGSAGQGRERGGRLVQTEGVLVRQRIEPGSAEAVRKLVADFDATTGTRRTTETPGTTETSGTTETPGTTGAPGTPLLPIEGVYTVSLFLERPRDPEEPPSPAWLVWFVEVGGNPGPELERDLPATIRAVSPLFDAGIGEHLDGAETVYARGRDGTERMVHVGLPERPRGDGEDSPEVALWRLRFRSGPGEWFVRALTRFMEFTEGTAIERAFDRWSEPVLEDERMWTETLFLERTEKGYAVLQYMEADSMAGVWEAYHETDNWIARASERVVGWFVERPERALYGDPIAQSDFELLAHAVNPDRP